MICKIYIDEMQFDLMGGKMRQKDRCEIDIYCKYDKQLNEFFNDVVRYTIEKYAFGLNIDTLKEIELIDGKRYKLKTDGKIINESKIIITSRLYNMLPDYKITGLYRNKIFKQIVCTIYHELGHINDMSLYPNLYNMVLKGEDRLLKIMAMLFWTEYLAEKRSVIIDPCRYEFCDEFLNTKWNPIKVDGNIGPDDFIYLNKVLPYFIARAETVKQKYFDKIENDILFAYVNELRVELNNLSKILPFDNAETLEKLCAIINKYGGKFTHNNIAQYD